MSNPDDSVDEEPASAPLKRKLHAASVVLLCLVGGFLLLWPYEDDRSLSRYRCHLEIIDGQLQGLKELLQDYKDRHGRYPTNDEGLAALDNFESHFTLTCHRDHNETPSRESSGFYGDGLINRFWGWGSKSVLKGFRLAHGRAPQNQEEFRDACLGPAYPESATDAARKLHATKVEVAIDRHDNIFLLDRSGVLTPWLLPYIYENRIGHHAKAFRESLADGDRWGCSVRADDGVYVSSSGGYLYAQEFKSLWWQRYGPRGFGVFLILLGVAVAVYGAARKRPARPLLAIVAVISGFLAGGFYSNVYSVTCYAPMDLFSDRSPEMVLLQRKLLEKYRENGVIDEETYRRAASAISGQTLEPDDNAENRRK